MDFKKTIEQQDIIDVMQTFGEKVIMPEIDNIEETGKLPHDFWTQMGELGILGLTMPEAYGGFESPYLDFILAMEELGKYSPGAVCATVTTLAAMNIINDHGSQEQKDKYLESLIAGEFVGSMAFTEAGTGSDPKQLTTVAKEKDGMIVLNGVKRFITNAAYEGPMVVYAKDADDGQCSAYIIDKFCEGYSLSKPWEKVGLAGSHVYDVFLDDVTIPKENLLGKKGSGFGVLLLESAHGKVGHSANALGIIAACLERAKKYAVEKVHRNGTIAQKFQAVQLKIATIAQKYEAARWMVYRAAYLADHPEEGEDFKAYAALTKGFVADLAPECALAAMNVLGAYGTMKEYSVERYMRDALIQPHIEVVSDVQRLIYAGSYLNR